MSYRGDIRLGDTLDIKFTSRRFSTGAPFTLAGSPVISAYVGNGTTEITAGITLTTDFDARTGLNNVRVVATSGNGFATATNVQLVITTGTVDSISVVGEVVAEFSIENRSGLMPTTAGRTLVVDAAGLADATMVKAGPTGSGTAQTAGDIIGDTNDIQARLPAALVSGRMSSDVVAISGDTTAADNAEAFFDGTGYAGTGNVIPTVTLVTTLTTYTGNTPQTGDSFARLGTPAGASVSADLLVIDNLVDDLETRLTASRAGYLDNLNVGGAVASSAEVTAITNNTRAVIVVPETIERPDSGTSTYRVELYLYDTSGNMEAPDSAPTIALVNQAGTDRSSRLDSTAMALVSTGRYRAIYTADVGDTLEQLVWTFSVVEGGATRVIGRGSIIVDTTAVDFTAADRTKLDTLHDTRLTAARAGYLENLSAGAVALETTAQSILTDTAEIGPAGAGLTNIDLPNQTMNITGNITGNLSGSVGSVTSGVTVTTNNDKTGYALSGPGVQAIWDALTSALTAVGSIGKLLVDNINAAIGSRASQTSVDDIPTNGESAAALAGLVLTSTERNAIAAAHLDLTDGVETGVTVRQSHRLANAANGAKTDGMATSTAHLRDLADTKNRVTATVDVDGNRTAVTRDLT